jgi:hypothetical protein
MGFMDGFKGAVTGATAALGAPHIALPVALLGGGSGGSGGSTSSFTAAGKTGQGDAAGPDPDAVHNNPWRAEAEGGCWCYKVDGCDHRPWLCGLVLCEGCNGSGVILLIRRIVEWEESGRFDERGDPILERICIEQERRIPCESGCDIGLVPWHETAQADADGVGHYSGTMAYTRYSYDAPDDAGPPPERLVSDECGG